MEKREMIEITGRICVEFGEKSLFDFDLQHEHVEYDDVIGVFRMLEIATYNYQLGVTNDFKAFESFETLSLEDDPQKICVAFNNETKAIQVSVTNLTPWEVAKASSFIVQYLIGKIIKYDTTNGD